MLQEVEERGLRPVDVLHDERDRPLAGTSRERLPHGPRDLFRCACRECGGKLLVGSSLAEDLDERPVRDAFAVGEATAGEDGRVAGQRHLELVRKP